MREETFYHFEKMKVLNLYSGIGGNRKLWIDCDVTAVELNEKVAAKYAELYPQDKIVVADAHEYLLDHYREFDFIWSSPPCQTHSRANYFINSIAKRSRYPDMSLWQEIIFLTQFCKTKFCVENVIGYYEPMIKPIEMGRHYLWANFFIPKIELPKGEVGTMMKQYVGTGKHAHDKPLEDRNAVNSELGLHIFSCALGKSFNKKDSQQQTLFTATKEALPQSRVMRAVCDKCGSENTFCATYNDVCNDCGHTIMKQTVA